MAEHPYAILTLSIAKKYIYTTSIIICLKWLLSGYISQYTSMSLEVCISFAGI
jgi:hypothetical protein